MGVRPEKREGRGAHNIRPITGLGLITKVVLLILVIVTMIILQVKYMRNQQYDPNKVRVIEIEFDSTTQVVDTLVSIEE